MVQPPLPNVLPFPTPSRAADGAELPNDTPISNRRYIRTGCWIVNYEPLMPSLARTKYDGTIRVENHPGGRTASGDLYQRPMRRLLEPTPLPTPRPPLTPSRRPRGREIFLPALPPNPAAGIPIQARSNYRVYLRITKIDEFFSFGSTFDLGLEMWRYTARSPSDFDFTKDASDYSITMTWMTAPTGYPSSNDYAEGDLKDATSGDIIGRLKMGWVSEFYRKCSIEIDTVVDSEPPVENGLGNDWQTVFTTVGYDLTVKLSSTTVPEENGPVWNEAELHMTMLAQRDRVDLDAEWAYYIIAVKEIPGVYGVMFDYQAADSNNIPREGAAICSHVMLSGDDTWGAEKNKRYGTATPLYFRTVVHELGHALGLRHQEPPVDGSYMNRTGGMLEKATAANPFVNLIKWNFSDENLKQLRHWPDVFIRPGGVEFFLATDERPLIAPTDEAVEMDALVLEVAPLLKEVPLGAPVRVIVTLTNQSQGPVLVPSDIGLKSGVVSGDVIDLAGTTRSFRPIMCYEKEESMTVLEAGESISTSLTLLRGGQGALFPSPGISTIIIKAHWAVGNGEVEGYAIGKATVMVTSTVDKSHAAAAHALLTTPDVLPVLVLGGDHLEEGMGAIQQALDDDTLRPHFACIEARRLAKRFFGREPDLGTAGNLVNDGACVMSEAEKAKLGNLGVQCG